ncbi:MAG TPA: flagellar motor switch protein FliN [Capsulimonadaceae bacterium]|nr:flagellar motor switch protein FliN [Capsulimonadaceae bacterium]
MPEPKEGNEAISQEALDALLADMSEKEADVFSEETTADPQAADETAEADIAAQSGDSSSADSADTAFDFASFQGGASPSAPGGAFRGFERVQDIPLEISVELGRTKLLIRDILDLESGAIIELEKMAGEPVDLLANGLLVARGEVVVIEDNFGVRITEIITQTERKEVADWREDRLAA